MLGMGYGQPMLFSSFAFDNYDWAPKDLDGRVLDAKCAQSSAIYFENHEAGTWLCQHRMNSVNGMIEFRDLTSGEPLLNPQTQDAFVSFERGTKGLFAVNVTGNKLAGIELTTNLPDGSYLDRISGKEFDVAAGSISFDLGPNQAIALTKK
jgi:alpha-amylase